VKLSKLTIDARQSLACTPCSPPVLEVPPPSESSETNPSTDQRLLYMHASVNMLIGVVIVQSFSEIQ